jgi:hypothetical protein
VQVEYDLVHCQILILGLATTHLVVLERSCVVANPKTESCQSTSLYCCGALSETAKLSGPKRDGYKQASGTRQWTHDIFMSVESFVVCTWPQCGPTQRVRHDVHLTAIDSERAA